MYDYDFMARDDYMGSCFLKITPEIYNKQKSEFTLQVLDREMKESNKYIGKLQIELAKLAWWIIVNLYKFINFCFNKKKIII